jgi:glycerol-3-phosphate dehydrogenase (NAD(P)+)
MNIAVLGAGGWGTALACLAADNGHRVVLWARHQHVADSINSSRENLDYLPGVRIPTGVEADVDPAVISAADMVISAIPTQYVRAVLQSYRFPLRGKLIVNAAKGIERGTHLRISQVFRDVLGTPSDEYAVLSGPSHAEEVARGVPTTVVVASTSETAAEIVQRAMSTPTFRIYRSLDVVGVELGGALKNVIAIAAGIVDGLAMGDNTKAALVTRGLAEISRLGTELGANPLTFSGLSGLGDLFVTCTSRYSRNRLVGERIGRGESLDEILASMTMVAEGIATTISALELASDYGIEMPIAEQVYCILFEGKDPRAAITELMTRQMKREH